MAINEEPPAPPPAEIIDTGSVAVSIDTQEDEEAEEKPEDGILVNKVENIAIIKLWYKKLKGVFMGSIKTVIMEP